jgi:hypothetical protein
MDLPVLLNLEYKDLWYGPYLRHDPNNKAADCVFSPVFSIKRKPSIGLRWQGNPGYDQDLHRSIPLVDMYDAVKDTDAFLLSLQRDTGLEELNGLPISDLSYLLDSFENTLSIINGLDVVVTSCTSVAHASAAMGKRTIVITPISAYYTWCHSTKQSPWYGDHVTVLRQQKPRVWDEPLAELKEIMENEYNVSN